MIYLNSAQDKNFPLTAGMILNIFPLKNSNGKYELVNKYSEKVSEQEYDSISYPILNYSAGEKGFTKFIIEKGKEELRTNFSKIKPSSLELIPFNKSFNWGYCDFQGNVVIKDDYYDAFPFSDGLALVKQGIYYLFINKNGEILKGLKFDDAFPFSEGLAAVKINGKYGFINTSGEIIIEPAYEEARYFTEGLAAVKISGKFGFINKENQLLINAEFEDVSHFSQSMAKYKELGKWGYINLSGEKVIEAKYYEAGNFYSHFAAVKVNSKYGYIKKSGEYFQEPIFDDAFDMFDDFSFAKKDNKWMLISEELTPLEDNSLTKQPEIITPMMNIAEASETPLAEDNSPIENSFNKGLDDIDKELNDIFEAEAKAVEQKDAIKEAAGALVNVLNERLHESGEDEKTTNSKDIILTPYQGENLWGYVDIDNNVIIKEQFDEARTFKNGLAAVRIGKKWGFINKAGQFSFPAIFAFVHSFSEGLALVTIDGTKFFYIDETGKNYFGRTFDYATDFKKGQAFIRDNHNSFIITKSGELLQNKNAADPEETSKPKSRKKDFYLAILVIFVVLLINFLNEDSNDDEPDYSYTDYSYNTTNYKVSDKYSNLKVLLENMQSSSYINFIQRAGSLTPSVNYFNYYYMHSTFNYLRNPDCSIYYSGDTVKVYFVLSNGRYEEANIPYFFLKNNNNLSYEIEKLSLSDNADQNILLRRVMLSPNDSLPMPSIFIGYDGKLIAVNSAYSAQNWTIPNTLDIINGAVDSIKMMKKPLSYSFIDTAGFAWNLSGINAILKTGLANPYLTNTNNLKSQYGIVYLSGMAEVQFTFNSFSVPDFLNGVLVLKEKTLEKINIKTVFNVQDIIKTEQTSIKTDKEYFTLTLKLEKGKKFASMLEMYSDNALISDEKNAEIYFNQTHLVNSDTYTLFFDSKENAKKAKLYFDYYAMKK